MALRQSEGKAASSLCEERKEWRVLPSLCSGPTEFLGPVTASQGLAGASRTASPAWRARLLSLHQARGIWKSLPHPLTPSVPRHGTAPVRRALSLPVLRPTRRDKSCRPCPVSLHSSESGSLHSANEQMFTRRSGAEGNVQARRSLGSHQLITSFPGMQRRKQVAGRVVICPGAQPGSGRRRPRTNIKLRRDVLSWERLRLENTQDLRDGSLLRGHTVSLSEKSGGFLFMA